MARIALTRADLSSLFPDNPKAVLAFEGLFYQGATAGEAITAQAEATQSLNDATVLVLSSNEAFTNERVLAVDSSSISLRDTGAGGELVIGLVNNVLTQGGANCTLNLQGDTFLNAPLSGTIATDEYWDAGPFTDDAAAAAGGIAINRPYRKTDGTVVWRQV